ncbi:FAD:protein FMN transferase [Roseomonas sp. CAU 1739]|uniref:FAD:protein FMN transferase n=1 Tax=Roseomonas sp. CAU 1739 TaxID=3140364 RepID=UPI00325C25BF
MHKVLIPTAFAPPSPPRGLPVQVLDGATMGTSWSVRCVAGGDAGRLRAEIERRLDRVISEMSGWRADSALSRFNRLPAGGTMVLPPGFRGVLECALATAAASGGAFDPTIGPLVDLWGFGAVPTIHEGPPPQGAMAEALGRVGWRQLAIDAAGGLRQPGGVALDLSGIAKGHAVDLVADGLEAAGVTCYLVEIGGELRGRGVKPDGSPWWVALERPVPDQAPGYLVALHDLAVATSGDYRRNFVHGGVTYGHTIDPRSGWPIAPDVVAVTVLHRRCMQADALATALAVLGLPAGLDHATRHGIAALVVARDAAGRIAEHMSPALAAMLD